MKSETAPVVFTGWYCTDVGVPRDYKVNGAEVNRGLAFRPLWWQSVTRCLGPAQVVVVDSASPLLPNDSQYFSGRLEHIRLPMNPGHAQNTDHHYCGWTASVLLGLEYALTSNMEYFLYVEQDVLLYGTGLLARIEDLLRRHRYVFGDGAGTAWPVQTSLFAIRKDGIRPFLSRLHAIGVGDRDLAPELKVGIAAASTSPLATVFEAFLHIPSEKWRTKAVRRTLKTFPDYACLPFGYGRIRPIRFEDDCFYFQQATLQDLEAYGVRVGVPLASLGIQGMG